MATKKKLEGKVAIVTGGASGIGETTARLFAEHGARAVVIVDIQPEKGRAVADSIGPQRCSYVECDVADEEQVAAMIERTATTYGGVDIMFSNAGTASSTASQAVLELDLAEYDRVMRVNACGMAVCVKQAARKMVELGSRGAIICSSSAMARGAFNLTDYVMSKRAVLGLMRSASMQLGAHGIRVNSVSLGPVLTPLAAKVGIVTAGDVERDFGPFTSLKGVALTAEHVAEAVVFMATDEAAFVTGHDLVVDGGMVCMPLFNLLN